MAFAVVSAVRLTWVIPFIPDYACPLTTSLISGFHRMYAKVLIVDDSPAERIYAGHLLRKSNDFRVTSVATGREALQITQTDRPSLIVSDVRMPEMNGLQLVEQLRDCGCSTTVVLITSAGSERLVVQAFLAGAASFVSKLNLEKTLETTIRRVLESENRRNRAAVSSEPDRFPEWLFAMENDPDGVPALIGHLLDVAIKTRDLQQSDCHKITGMLKSVLGRASIIGSVNLDANIREVLDDMLDPHQREAITQP